MDEYELPSIPEIKLSNPTSVLHVAMEKSRDQRVHYRAKHIPMEDLFSQEELEDLENQFQLGVGVNNETQTITMVYLMAILNQMNFELEGKPILTFSDIKRRRAGIQPENDRRKLQHPGD